eukprot:360763-Chlamydomonas_euryale.AAC.5
MQAGSYGRHLSVPERRHFECLRHNYEVRFHLDALEAVASGTGGGAGGAIGGARGEATPVAARNRRLAQLLRLKDDGEYFSMEAMQQRAPLLYQQYVGCFEDGGGEAAGEP